jgi:phosphoserine aminotransferase
LNPETPTESLVLMGVRDFFKWLNNKGGLKNLTRRTEKNG